MGAEGVAWATTGTRWMIAAIMLIFVAALTPGFRRSRLRERGSASSARSRNRHRHFQHRRMGRFQRHLHHRHLGLHRGQRCLWLFGAGDGRVLHVLFRHRHGHIRAQRLSGGAIRRVKNAGRSGVAATMVMGLFSACCWCLAGPISRLLVEDAIIGGIAIAPAIAALLWLAAAATVFDGLQATASLSAAGAGHGGCRARSISARVLRGDDPGLLLAGHSAGGAVQRGCWKGRLSASSWRGRRSSSCWNGKRRAPVWNALPDPDRSPWGSEPSDVFQSRCRFESREAFWGFRWLLWLPGCGFARIRPAECRSRQFHEAQ